MTDLLIAAALALFTGIAAWRVGGKLYKYGPSLEPAEPPEPEPPPVPPTPPTPIDLPPVKRRETATLENLCLGIKEHEGWILPGGKDWTGKVYPRGSRSYQNHSPGNVRFHEGGYLATYGQVRRDPDNFAIFKDEGTGWRYLNNMVRGIIRKHPHLTLYEFFAGKKGVYSGYAPKEDHNDSENYAKVMGKRLGVDPFTYKVINLL